MHSGYNPKPRDRRPGELLFTFRDSRHRQVDCELVDRAQWGVEAMFLVDRELRMSRRFETKALAIHGRE